MSTNRIIDISPLSGLGNLTELNLSYNQITDASPLAGSTNLTNLNLVGNNLAEPPPVQSKGGLLDNHEDSSVLDALLSLNTLNLADNQIIDLSPLANLADLESIDLSGNLVEVIESLASLPGLESIDLSGNQVIDITPLGSLDLLEVIDITDNAISDITALSNLDNLTEINLGENPIDLSDGSLQQVILSKLSSSIAENLEDKETIQLILGESTEGESELLLFWSATGTLQISNDLIIWEDVPDAIAPFTLPASNEVQTFWRIVESD